MLITKASGEQEEFQPEKLKRSLESAGASKQQIEEIVSHVLKEMKEGMTTDDIYTHAFELLKKMADKGVAARYSLRRAVMDLGPSGFPFESFLGELLKAQGYKVETGVSMQGKCAPHEIDVVGRRGEDMVVVEAKFHNRAGYKTDLKTALYVYARFHDLAAAGIGECVEGEHSPPYALITNTKFTNNAKKYAQCTRCLRLVGWNYPEGGSLQELIEEASLHPLTCLTTLSQEEKRALFDRGVVLCRTIKEGGTVLKDAGISGKRVREIEEEAAYLCSRSGSGTLQPKL